MMRIVLVCMGITLGACSTQAQPVATPPVVIQVPVSSRTIIVGPTIDDIDRAVTRRQAKDAVERAKQDLKDVDANQPVMPR